MATQLIRTPHRKYIRTKTDYRTRAKIHGWKRGRLVKGIKIKGTGGTRVWKTDD